MPISHSFYNRLSRILPRVVEHYGTPFHIYDEIGIRETGQLLIEHFSAIPGFREYFAVKALPNPEILRIMKSMGFGFDCSSIAELILSRNTGSTGEELMFTSNNTRREEFLFACKDGGSILNLDDITLISKLTEIPELICFRYNPGSRRTGNSIIGNPEEAKYGVHHDQIVEAYQTMINLGSKRFGLHTMLASNERNYVYMVETAIMLLELAESISRELSIRFEFINIGGGFGIPYKPGDAPLDMIRMASEISQAFTRFKEKNGYMPKLYIESGRYMTGPHGALVVTAINEKNTYRKYIGVDACMSALMRPALYGAHHEITVFGKEKIEKSMIADVVGSLCENNDKFAIQRPLPEIHTGDLLIIHDTGAHGHAMGFNYNGKLRPKELLLRQDGDVELIRREETIADHFTTLEFEKDILTL
ncbi:MAG: diaminopimelate decarboxylase [Deltaproteobacteria bacterium]|nr:MAG: diaminopimelate decarboxylase [Deltaproteobacteria bacterium]